MRFRRIVCLTRAGSPEPAKRVRPAVRLTFNNTPIALSSEIVIKDESGTNQSEGAVVTVDNYVTHPAPTREPADAAGFAWALAAGGTMLATGLYVVRRRPSGGKGNAS